jgi:hypothetical protein
MKWRVRKTKFLWSVFTPEGVWSGDFETFPEAIEWATDWFSRLDYWRMSNAVQDG